MHPMFNLIMTRPQLLAAHAHAYGDLLAVEWPRAMASVKRQALLHTLAGVGLFAALLLAGVAAMLCAVLPVATMAAPWWLVVVPALPAAAAVACLVAARAGAAQSLLDPLRQQLRADLAMLRDIAAD